jgi:hypothetical protein
MRELAGRLRNRLSCWRLLGDRGARQTGRPETRWIEPSDLHVDQAAAHLARDAGRTYPSARRALGGDGVFRGKCARGGAGLSENANLAASFALARLGFDEPSVQLIADPAAKGNTEMIEADNKIGTMTVVMAGHASANPRASASTAFSRLHAIHARSAQLVI